MVFTWKANVCEEILVRVPTGTRTVLTKCLGALGLLGAPLRAGACSQEARGIGAPE